MHEKEKIYQKKTLIFRILPHQQNTGGFFVALLEKKALCPWEKQVLKQWIKSDIIIHTEKR